MISVIDRREILRRGLWLVGLLALLLGLGLLFGAVSAQRVAGDYAQAADFPRGALVYAQCSDLPGLIKQWNESALKERFFQSVSYRQMWERHLLHKLHTRWEEFNAALGFQFDLSVLGGAAEQRAAAAVYDIGRLDLVFIAPMNEAQAAATRFFAGKEQFEETTLSDGTIYYVHDVEADRGRQKQELAFAAVRGRFVLTTSEQLMLRVLANINQQTRKDRLSDEPAFQALSRSVKPHQLAVWVDQARLNGDWYFRHYWVQQNADELTRLRAGLFDFEMQAQRWVERREFLLSGKQTLPSRVLPREAVRRVEAMVPRDVPFVRMTAASDAVVVAAVREALFEWVARRNAGAGVWDGWQYGYDDARGEDEYFGDGEGSRFAWLSGDFDSIIDDSDDAGVSDDATDDTEIRAAGERRFEAALRQATAAARPAMVTTVARPRAADGLLFTEFGRAAVISLQDAGTLDRRALERAFEELARARLMIAGAAARFEWRDKIDGDARWRELTLPVLGRALGYGVRGAELIAGNNVELLAALLKHRGDGGAATTEQASELTVIRLSTRAEAFDQIVTKLDAPRVQEYWRARRGDDAGGPSQEFFSGNIAGLLDVAAPVDEVRLRRNYAGDRLREELAFVFKR